MCIRDRLLIVLRGIEKVISSDQKVYKFFIISEIYQKFYFDVPEIAEPLFGIFLMLFTISPTSVTLENMDCIKNYISICPEKVLRLLNIITSHKKIPSGHILFAKAVDIIFNNANDFISAGSSRHLLQLIYSLRKQIREFKNNSSYSFERVLQIVLDNLDDNSEYALDIILNDPKIKISISPETISSLLHNEKLIDKTLSAIIQMDQDLQDNSLLALINYAKKSKFACLTLCQRCLNEQIAIRMANLGKNWLLEELPDLDGTLRILLVIMQHENARQYLPVEVSHPLLAAVTPKHIRYIYPAFMKLSVTQELLNSLGNDFLAKYYSVAFRNGPELIITALSITDKIARCGFFKGFVGIIHYIKKLLENEKWKSYAIPTIAELSMFDEMKTEFAKENIEFPNDLSKLF